MKKLYIGTNTKMYKTITETVSFLTTLQNLTADIDRSRMELFVIPSYTTLEIARRSVPKEQIKLGAQNMGWEEQGQFTGEVSPLMLQEIGMDIVMIGHSERRHVFRETDEEENKKVLSALEHGFTPLLCIGETLEQRERNIGTECLSIQLKAGLHGVTPEQAKKVWVAYEPVWSIGVNGTPATAQYAEKMHEVIKETLREIFGETGESIPVLYGGSVNPQNANQLIIQPSVDGLFVGRSAWQAQAFEKLIRNAKYVYENQ